MREHGCLSGVQRGMLLLSLTFFFFRLFFLPCFDRKRLLYPVHGCVCVAVFVRCFCQVRFANALRGGGTNFTITETQADQLTLDLVEGSTWRKVSWCSLPLMRPANPWSCQLGVECRNRKATGEARGGAILLKDPRWCVLHTVMIDEGKHLRRVCMHLLLVRSPSKGNESTAAKSEAVKF